MDGREVMIAEIAAALREAPDTVLVFVWHLTATHDNAWEEQ